MIAQQWRWFEILKFLGIQIDAKRSILITRGINCQKVLTDRNKLHKPALVMLNNFISFSWICISYTVILCGETYYTNLKQELPVRKQHTPSCFESDQYGEDCHRFPPIPTQPWHNPLPLQGCHYAFIQTNVDKDLSCGMALPKSNELDILIKYSQRLASGVEFFKSMWLKTLNTQNPAITEYVIVSWHRWCTHMKWLLNDSVVIVKNR